MELCRGLMSRRGNMCGGRSNSLGLGPGSLGVVGSTCIRPDFTSTGTCSDFRFMEGKFFYVSTGSSAPRGLMFGHVISLGDSFGLPGGWGAGYHSRGRGLFATIFRDCEYSTRKRRRYVG